MKKYLANLARNLVPSTNLLLFLLQLVAFLAVLYGISFWSVPAALIVGGVAAIVAVEMQTREVEDDPQADKLVREIVDDALKHGKNPFEHGVPQTERWIRYVDVVTRPLTFPAGIKG